jgi:hypothetical protein
MSLAVQSRQVVGPDRRRMPCSRGERSGVRVKRVKPKGNEKEARISGLSGETALVHQDGDVRLSSSHDESGVQAAGTEPLPLRNASSNRNEY